MPICFCAIGCQHSTFNRLLGCVFLVWRHHLWKVNKSSVHAFRRFFSAIFLYLMFLNIQIYWIILKTYDQQFTLTTKKSLHIIFKCVFFRSKFWEIIRVEGVSCFRNIPVLEVSSLSTETADVASLEEYSLNRDQCPLVTEIQYCVLCF